MEGAGVEQLLRDDAEVVHHAQAADGEAQQEARQLQQCARDLLGVVVLAAVFDLVDLLIHLAVDVKDRVRRGKDGLDGRLVRGGGHGAAHGQHDLDVVARVDAAACHEAVDAGTHGDHAHIGRDEQMQVAETLVALEPLLTQPAVGVRDLDAVLKLVAGVVLRGHDVGHELVKRRERLDQATVLAVSETAFALHMKIPPNIRIKFKLFNFDKNIIGYSRNNSKQKSIENDDN